MRSKVLIIVITVLSGVMFHSEAMARKKKPKWVSQRPVDNNYYVGIGVASKSGSNADYIQIAKNNALTDMASEISVQISSTSLLHQFEDNTGFKEVFDAYTKTVIKDELEGFEIVDSWSDADHYWVYYHLSKSDYQRRKREKLERAKKLSQDLLFSGKKAEESFDYNNALIFYLRAFDGIKKYLGQDLSIFAIDEGKIFLDNAIFESILRIFSSIEIYPMKDHYHLSALSSQNEPVIFHISDRNSTRPLKSIPILFTSPENMDVTDYSLSNDTGICFTQIGTSISKGASQTIKAEINIDQYFEDDSNSILRDMLIHKESTPYHITKVDIKEITAYLDASETYLGIESSRQQITSILRKELSKGYFDFIDKKELSDVIISIESRIIEGEKLNKHDLHTVYLDCTISITHNTSGEVIYTQGFTGLKGVNNGGFDRAAENAIKKAEQKIETEIISKIKNINL